MKSYAKQLKIKSSTFFIRVILKLCFFLFMPESVIAQFNHGSPVQPQAPGRAEAPFDLSGTWVSLVTEDWAYRMVTPAVGDTMSVPVNEAAREITNQWDLEADIAAGLQCRAFGAARIMRVPTRLQISWEDDYSLRIDADAGSQTRIINFSRTGRRPLVSMMLEAATTERRWQGYSVADWENVLIDRSTTNVPIDTPPPGGTLKVITTRMLAGYLRPNGVPYSEDAILTEYYNPLTAPDGEEWFVVTTIVDDPMYLLQPYVTSSHFRRERDDSNWNPTPCETWAPPEGSVAPRF